MKWIVLLVTIAFLQVGCDQPPPSADQVQAKQQAVINQEGTRAVGMPNIKNFRERKLLKEIKELRDQDGLVTYTYIVAEQTGKLVFICNSIGYGIPAATQFTNPEQDIYATASTGVHMSMPQADPNGLFSPSSAEGTWVMCGDPHGNKTRPVYMEPRIVVSPFKLD